MKKILIFVLLLLPLQAFALTCSPDIENDLDNLKNQLCYTTDNETEACVHLLGISYVNSLMEEDRLRNTTKPLAEYPTDLYACDIKPSQTCPGDLSGVNKDGLQTRCYNAFKIGWTTCSTGWTLI